jgi:DUF4097 and DUF4098 domain-containing protein YvlB
MRLRSALAVFVVSLCAAQVFAGDRVYVSKMGGDIDLDDATSGATLRTMGGDIRIGRAGIDVVAKTMGGDIDVRELVGDLDAGSMGGNISVRVAGGNGNQRITLKSMGGAVELTVPHNFDATFELEVRDSKDGESASIESDIPLTHASKEHWSFWHGTEHTLTATKTQSTQNNRVEITTYGNSRITIHRQ